MTLEEDLKEMYPNDDFKVKRIKNKRYRYIEVRKVCVQNQPQKSMVSELIFLSNLVGVSP